MPIWDRNPYFSRHKIRSSSAEFSEYYWTFLQLHQEIWLMFLILPKTLAHPPKKKGGMKGINDLTIAPPFAVVLFCEICKQSKFISWGIIWELKGQNTKKYSDVVIPKTCAAFVCIFQWLPLLKSSSLLTFIAHPLFSRLLCEWVGNGALLNGKIFNFLILFRNEMHLAQYSMGVYSLKFFFVIMPLLHFCCKYPYKTLVCNP